MAVRGEGYPSARSTTGQRDETAAEESDAPREWTSPRKKGARGSESNLFPCVGRKVERKTARNSGRQGRRPLERKREREKGGERRGRLQEIVLGARREFSSRFGAPLAGAPRGEPGARKIKASPPLGMPLPSFPPAPMGEPRSAATCLLLVRSRWVSFPSPVSP